MATAHSKTQRAKGNSDTIVIKSAWSVAFESLKVKSLDDYRKEGWKTVGDIIKESGASVECAAAKKRLLRLGLYEHRAEMVKRDGTTIKTSMFRPKA